MPGVATAWQHRRGRRPEGASCRRSKALCGDSVQGSSFPGGCAIVNPSPVPLAFTSAPQAESCADTAGQEANHPVLGPKLSVVQGPYRKQRFNVYGPRRKNNVTLRVRSGVYTLQASGW